MEAAHMSFAQEVIKLRELCKDRGIEITNLNKRNYGLTKKVLELETENKKLHLENNELKKEQQALKQKQGEQEKALEGLRLIVEELRRMIFREKKPEKPDTGNAGQDGKNISEGEQKKERKKANRTAASYRRAIPPEESITDCIEHRLEVCPDCGRILTEIKHIIRYVEDLIDLTKIATVIKKIEKHIIWSGYCSSCKKRKIAAPINPQMSTLGEQIQWFIAYEIVIMQKSFSQVQSFLRDIANFVISDGEIVTSIGNQAKKLETEKERIIQKVRAAPGSHYDETIWNVQKEGQGNYCWIRRPTQGEEAIFLFGRSRGKGNAEELKGETDEQVGISDDYRVYKNMFTKHQLCMSHPQRKLRDLKNSGELTGERQKQCEQTYGEFSTLYKKLEATLATEYEKETWDKKKTEYIAELKSLAELTGKEPEKLKKIKAGLTRNAEKYFTCLDKPGIPADNNKAERGLRHVVLKRKKSYGSKTQKGADIMGILCTTLLSCWWNKPANFFVAYKQMLAS